MNQQFFHFFKEFTFIINKIYVHHFWIVAKATKGAPSNEGPRCDPPVYRYGRPVRLKPDLLFIDKFVII